MNLMPEILEKLGLEIDERFDVESDGVKVLENVYFDSGYFLVDIFSEDHSAWLSNILSGTVKIVKKPWNPKGGETYFCVYIDGQVVRNTFMKWRTDDCAFIAMGNCFRTKEEAEAAKPEMLKKMKEAMKEAWE